jgi:hypothetical protein
VGYTSDGVGTNAAGTKTSKEGSAVVRSWGGGSHGDLGRWAEGSSGRWTVGERKGPGTASGDGENDKGTRWKIQTVVMIKSGRLTGGNGARGKTDFKARWRVGKSTNEEK